jgi:hypothetical protein
MESPVGRLVCCGSGWLERLEAALEPRLGTLSLSPTSHGPAGAGQLSLAMFSRTFVNIRQQKMFRSGYI